MLGTSLGTRKVIFQLLTLVLLINKSKFESKIMIPLDPTCYELCIIVA